MTKNEYTDAVHLLVNNNNDDDDVDDAVPHKVQPLYSLSSRHGWPACQRLLPIEIHIRTCAAVFYVNQFIAWYNMLTVLK